MKNVGLILGTEDDEVSIEQNISDRPEEGDCEESIKDAVVAQSDATPGPFAVVVCPQDTPEKAIGEKRSMNPEITPNSHPRIPKADMLQ